MPVGEEPWDQACKTLVIASSVDQGMSKAPPAQAPPTAKGKGVALPVIPDELRHNASLPSKQDTAKGAGRGNETGTSSTSSVGVSQSGDELQLKQLPSKVAKMGSDWACLPAELLILISEKVSTTNVQYVHLRTVCKAWQRALTPNPCHLPRQSPWLLLPPRGVYNRSSLESCHLSFYDLSQSRTHQFELPYVSGKHLYGSYYGWLVLVCDKSVSLHNPITRRSIELPSFDAPPTISKRGSSIPLVSTLYVQKVALSCNPSERGCVAVAWLLDLPKWELGFCRIGDTHWTGIMMRDACQTLMNFTCNNKLVYTVNTKLEVLAYDLESLTMRTFPSKINFNGMRYRIHLVEGDAEDDGPLVVLTTEYLGKPKQIYVYKWINYEQRWRRVKNIGNSVLFLSRDNIFNSCGDCTKLQLEEHHGNELYYNMRHDVATRGRDDIFLSRDDIFLGCDDYTKLQLEVPRGDEIYDDIRHDVAKMGFRICINKINLQSGGIHPHFPSSTVVFYNKLQSTLWFTPSLI